MFWRYSVALDAGWKTEGVPDSGTQMHKDAGLGWGRILCLRNVIYNSLAAVYCWSSSQHFSIPGSMKKVAIGTMGSLTCSMTGDMVSMTLTLHKTLGPPHYAGVGEPPKWVKWFPCWFDGDLKIKLSWLKHIMYYIIILPQYKVLWYFLLVWACEIETYNRYLNYHIDSDNDTAKEKKSK